MTITTGKYLERRLHGLKADRVGGGGGGVEGPGAPAAELPSLFSSSLCSAFLVFSNSEQNFLFSTSCFTRISSRFSFAQSQVSSVLSCGHLSS